MILLYILVGILVLGVFYFFAIAPSHSQDLTAYAGWHFAHRGLHSLSPDTPENSLSAFRQAIAMAMASNWTCSFPATGRFSSFMTTI